MTTGVSSCAPRTSTDGDVSLKRVIVRAGLAIMHVQQHSRLSWQPVASASLATAMPGEGVRRVRCAGKAGEPTLINLCVRHERIYLMVNGDRVLLDEAAAVHLLTALGECHWCLVHGAYYDDAE